jgi:hypothetical protein
MWGSARVLASRAREKERGAHSNTKKRRPCDASSRRKSPFCRRERGSTRLRRRTKHARRCSISSTPSFACCIPRSHPPHQQLSTHSSVDHSSALLSLSVCVARAAHRWPRVCRPPAPVLDPRAGAWPATEAPALAGLAVRCVAPARGDRPDLRAEVLATLAHAATAAAAAAADAGAGGDGARPSNSPRRSSAAACALTASTSASAPSSVGSARQPPPRAEPRVREGVQHHDAAGRAAARSGALVLRGAAAAARAARPARRPAIDEEATRRAGCPSASEAPACRP